mmetsp:Transcript_9915/g.13368  ORF Transcript_9915/g.13368 Transcript_9915/m.13368 type:complete len:434 (+) Transcript_9915:65-1366(+)
MSSNLSSLIRIEEYDGTQKRSEPTSVRQNLLETIRNRKRPVFQSETDVQKPRPKSRPLDKIVASSTTGSFMVHTSLFVQFLNTVPLIEDYTAANRKCSDNPPPSDVLDLPEPEEDWLSDLVSYLSEWLTFSLGFSERKIQSSKTEEESVSLTASFWAEWEWILSRSEELAMKHAQKQSNTIRNELASLKQRANLFKLRPFFRHSTNCFWESLDPAIAERLKESLDASKRNKIMRDMVKSLKKEWMENFEEIIFSKSQKEEVASSFESLFDEKPYEKNLEGAIVSMAFFASHGAVKDGLTSVLLSEILWNIWSVLWKSIQKYVEEERFSVSMNQKEAEEVAKETLKALPVIINLWAETAKNAKGGSEREGKLVNEWIEEERIAEEKRLQENIPPDFKYSPFTPDPFVKRKSTLSAKRLQTLKSKLDVLYGHSVE